MSFRTIALFLSMYAISNLIHRANMKYDSGIQMCYATSGTMRPLFVQFVKNSQNGDDDIHLVDSDYGTILNEK